MLVNLLELHYATVHSTTILDEFFETNRVRNLAWMMTWRQATSLYLLLMPLMPHLSIIRFHSRRYVVPSNMLILVYVFFWEYLFIYWLSWVFPDAVTWSSFLKKNENNKPLAFDCENALKWRINIISSPKKSLILWVSYWDVLLVLCKWIISPLYK